MSTQTVQIKFKRHSGQKEFHQSLARFRVLACGRRWGKTKIGAVEFILMMLACPERAVGFCVAPTYWHTQKQRKEFKLFCPAELIVSENRSEHLITLIGERQVWFKSADNPDSLRSEGIDVLWLDEGGQVSEDAWNLGLRPALMDKKGHAIFTGTPKGKNWYFQIWTRGQDPQQKDYKSWTFPSSSNPYLDLKEIAEFARDMPERAYKQEILGEFIEDVGSVFRNVEGCIAGSLEGVTQGKTYVMGADLAKHEDYTVLCVLDDNSHLCGFERFSQLDWVFNQQRIVNLCNRYNARLLVDATGVGDPILDQLKRASLRVEGYKFTSASKSDLIENLSMMIDNRKISYPNIPELINELKLYGYTTSRGGTVQYGAPEGYHDDIVIGLALAAWQLKKPQGYWG